MLLACALFAAGCPSKPERQQAAQPPSASAPSEQAAPTEANERARERELLFEQIAKEHDISDARVLAALRKVPRHRFVPEALQGEAYANRPLPIGHGQTISQPTVVAFMTHAVKPQAHESCLEIGTGSGYQAAVLAELCKKVYSIEYLEPLAHFAKENLRGAGYGEDKVVLRTGDGYRGWPEAAPFEVIVVTAAPPKVPEPLLEQLAIGGRLVIPVGAQSEVQRLELWRRTTSGQAREAFEVQQLMGVRFVPFVGEAERQR